MKSTPFFSIVIANYNHGQFLERAIMSVLNQNCDDYELILVDGGSQDNSLEIIRRYQDFFSWWVSEKDNGQSHAFNKGFSNAKGRFYFWLNADDELLPQTLYKAKNILQKAPEAVWISGNMITINESDLILSCKRGPAWIDFLIKYGVVYVYGPTSIFHHRLFEEVGGFDEELHYTMDFDLWFKFINRGYKFHKLHHYCWALRIHEASKTSHAFTNQPSATFAIERQKTLKKNEHVNHKWIGILQFLFKIISGVYLKSIRDTYMYKGKNITILNK